VPARVGPVSSRVTGASPANAFRAGESLRPGYRWG
jgi:hypothetical protein